MNKHGEFLFSWEKNILTIQAKGPFNENGALAETNKIKEFILKKNVTKWCKLGIWDDESLGPLSAIKVIEEYQQWCTKHGCIKTGNVVSNSIQKSIAEKIYNRNGKVFLNERDAKKWLLSQIS